MRGNAKVSRWDYCPMQSLNASGFTLQWKIGLTKLTIGMVLSRWARVGSGRLRIGSAGVCVGFTWVLRYQHVGICNTKVSQ